MKRHKVPYYDHSPCSEHYCIQTARRWVDDYIAPFLELP